MPAWSVSIRTPIKDKRTTIRGPFRTEAEVIDFVKMQQSAILLKSMQTAMPKGEIIEVRRAKWPDDFKKRPAMFAVQDSTSGPALCK